MAKGMGGHESKRSQTQEWLTPPWILERLGRFDLDPCAPIKRPWDTADRHYTTEDDGLALPWSGRVWLNPPYNNVDLWLKKLANHGDGIALIYARTETTHFFRCVWGVADGILFLKKRIKFYHLDGTMSDINGGAPSVLIAYGKKNAECLRKSNIRGAFVGKHKIISEADMFDADSIPLSMWRKICLRVKWALGWRYIGCVGLWKVFNPKRNLFIPPYGKNLPNLTIKEIIGYDLGERKTIKCGRAVGKSTTGRM